MDRGSIDPGRQGTVQDHVLEAAFGSIPRNLSEWKIRTIQKYRLQAALQCNACRALASLAHGSSGLNALGHCLAGSADDVSHVEIFYAASKGLLIYLCCICPIFECLQKQLVVSMTAMVTLTEGLE